MRNSLRFPHLFRNILLRDLSDDFKNRFLDECVMRSYDHPSTVLAQGQMANGAMIIAHGTVEITNVNDEGRTVLIHLCRQNEVIGDVEVLSDLPGAASCIAAAGTVLLIASKSLLLESLENRTFLRNVMAVNYERLVRDNTIKFVDSFYSVEQRLCDYLFRLSVDRPEISKTQADLAGLLGCARQTLNRELGRLRERQIIHMEKGKIRVLDRQGLLDQITAGDVGPAVNAV